MNRTIALAFMLLLTLAIALSCAAEKLTVLPFDQKSYHELQEQAGPFFDKLMQGISYLGEPAAAMGLIAMAAAIFALRGQLLDAIFMLATTSSVLLAFVLKELIHRARPFPIAGNTSGLFQSINQYSYPSGHVLIFVVFFGFFAYLAWMQFAGRLRMAIVVICAALIVLIGPSRVFLGAHWASDVVGSYIIGTIWLFILILACQRAMRWKETS
ncbi:MAG TPA: phosphatase PAP2 family protein [Methanotrichaceae archaeon]|nr:phosphatase PAP2 family protein [Methanotrichaceae archaeon]